MREPAGELAERFHPLRAAQRVLRLATPRHVELAAEMVQQLAVRIEDRRDEQRVPERPAVLLVVQHLDRDVGAVPQRGAHHRNRLGIGAGPLHEPAVAPHHLLGRVAGELEEGVVGEDDRVVRQVRVGDQHRHAGHLDSREEDVVAAKRLVQPHRRAGRLGRVVVRRRQGLGRV
jgi:hypothetical protein